MDRLKIIFFGSAEFAVPSLRELTSQPDCSIELVVTQPARPVGRAHIIRATPVQRVAEELGIRVTHSIEDVFEVPADLGVVVAHGTLLSNKVLRYFAHGVLNVHPSLLPAWRGPSPIQAALLAGDTKTGVTIMQVDSGMDTGPIVSQETYILRESDTAETLLNLLAKKGAQLLVKTLPAYVIGQIHPKAQSEEGVSSSAIILRTDGKITGQDDPAVIMRKIRAYTPWPGVYGIWNGKRLKILHAHLEQGQLMLDRVQLDGKPAMSFEEFLKGHPQFCYAALI